MNSPKSRGARTYAHITRNSVLYLVALLTLGHLAYRTADVSNDYDYCADGELEPPDMGQSLPVPITSLGGIPLGNLSEVGGGSCRYIIVASGTCPFSKRAARSWTSRAATNSPMLPDGWLSFWVLVEPATVADEFLDAGFPVERYRPSDNNSFMKDVGVTAFPFHIVLDRAGRVTASGPRAPVPDPGAFSPDCRMDLS